MARRVYQSLASTYDNAVITARNCAKIGGSDVAIVDNVLAAVSQFPQDDVVLTRSAEIALAHHAKLTVMQIIDDFSWLKAETINLGLIRDEISHAARSSIEAAVSKQAHGVSDIEICIETGTPSVRLIEKANALKSGLIVMRAHQSDSIVEKFIGSTTDRLIRASASPVLVLKRPSGQDYQRVVVATQISEDSDAAADYVGALFPLAGLDLVHVVHIPHQFEEMMLRAGHGAAETTAHRNALVRQAQNHLDKLSARLKDRAAPSHARVVTGQPAKTLVKLTKSQKVGLIALMPGSTNAVQRMLLGSVTRRVLRTAACDVLICRTGMGGIQP